MTVLLIVRIAAKAPIVARTARLKFSTILLSSIWVKILSKLLNHIRLGVFPNHGLSIVIHSIPELVLPLVHSSAVFFYAPDSSKSPIQPVLTNR